MMNTQPLHELVAAAHSPFHTDGSIAPEAVARQAAFLSLNGIRTVFITGSTGESHSVTCAEKLALYDAWAAAAPQLGLHVIAHVGGNCLEDAKCLARRAGELGFRAVSALAPSYYRPGDVDALISCCAEIAAAAPSTPFYYYDIPVLTNVVFPMDRLLERVGSRIPNFAGIKYTNPDLVSYARSLEAAGDRFDLPWGVDEALLPALALGARGGVGSTYNWAPKLYLDLTAAFHAGDMDRARALQLTSIRMIDAIASTGYLGTAKALMGRLGAPLGPARLPLAPGPSESQVDALMAKLDSLGFAEWGARTLPD